MRGSWRSAADDSSEERAGQRRQAGRAGLSRTQRVKQSNRIATSASSSWTIGSP